MIELLISFCIASAGLAISPGPDNIYVLTQSITNGISYGIATTAGLITGCILHTTLVAFGISAVLMTTNWAVYFIKIAGVCYLLYLAFKVFKTNTTWMISSNKNLKYSHTQLFKQGLIMNILNPKVTLFFMAFFPAFLWNTSGNTTAQFYILGGLFMLITFIFFSTIAILSSPIASLLQRKKYAGTFLKWLQIIVFVAIAIVLLLP